MKLQPPNLVLLTICNAFINGVLKQIITNCKVCAKIYERR